MEKAAGAPLCRKKCVGQKKTRPAEKSHNGVPAEKQSKKKETNAKSVDQESWQEARWNIRRHPHSKLLFLKVQTYGKKISSHDLQLYI